MSLEDRLDSFPQPWKPKPGDKLIGEVTERNTRGSDYGEAYEIVTVIAEKGSSSEGEPIAVGTEVAAHCFHTMARSGVERGNPQPGDRFGISYFGPAEQPSAPGMSPAERYRVIVEKPSAPVAGESNDENESEDGQSDDDVPF